jgi:hypothetical protein
LRRTGDREADVAISAKAAVRDDPVLMDVTPLGGPGLEVNAHCQGVFHPTTLKNYEEEPFSHPNDINVTSKRILGHWVQPSSDPQDLFVSIVLEICCSLGG